jgi:LacI family transcriptional regulator
MRDVAALSGVSLKTVSRVINGESGVSDTLITRVREAAGRLDYQHNLGASSLRRRDRLTGTIGLMLDDISNPFSSGLHRAVEDAARERGVAVFAGSLDEEPERERELAEAFIARRVDGLIVVPTSRDQSHLAREQSNGTPIVCLDRPPRLLETDAVYTDNRSSARRAVNHLINHGHTAIAFLGDLESIRTAVDRRAGYSDAMNDSQLDIDPALTATGLRSVEQSTQAVGAMLKSKNPPTAIFASQNLLTMGAALALREAGRSRDVALVGFDDVPLRELLDPGLTVVVQDIATLGSEAARLLFQRLDGYSGPYDEIVLPAQLVLGGSGEIRGTGLISQGSK